MQHVVGDDIQPNRDVIESRTITIDDFVGVFFVRQFVEKIVVITSAFTLAERHKLEARSDMILEPNHSSDNDGKPIKQKVKRSNHQQCFPTGGKQQKYAGVDTYVNKTRQ